MNKFFFGATDKGRVRLNNEDDFFVRPVLNGAYLAACVIDGVGGYEGGEVAAQIAHDALLNYLSVPSGEVGTMMAEAMVAANDQIMAAKKNNPQLADMACVATLALVDEASNLFYYIHVGDTRLYLFRDGSLVKVTKDQSFVGFLEDSGRLSEEAAMQHLKRNEIDKALGFDGQLRAIKDYFDAGTSPFLPGDLLLLCSDGLTDLVTAGRIKEVLQAKATLQQKVESLISAANEAGGKDNITVVLVQHSRSPEKQKAVKPKKKTVRNPKPVSVSNAAPQAPETRNDPHTQPSRKKKNWLLYLLLTITVAVAVIFIWKPLGKQSILKKNPSQTRGEILLTQLLQSTASDSLILNDSIAAAPIVLTGSLYIGQDTLFIKANGLHLVADTSFRGAGMVLAPSSRYLHLQDMVLENFNVGILAKGQTLQLKNVQFLNCAVPVQYGYTIPVNSPVDLLIKDSVFSIADTTVPK